MRREYAVELTEPASEGFAALDRGDQTLVLKQFEKLRHNPELGQPLRGELVNYRKLYVAKKRLRVVYRIEQEVLIVTVVAVGRRESAAVYAVAEAQANQRRLRLIE